MDAYATFPERRRKADITPEPDIAQLTCPIGLPGARLQALRWR